MALELKKELQDWNVETLRSMVEKLGKIQKGFFSTGEPVGFTGRTVYDYCESYATAGIALDADSCRFTFNYSGMHTFTGFGFSTITQEIVSEELYTIEPTLVDESMFLDFMIFIGECSEKIEG